MDGECKQWGILNKIGAKTDVFTLNMEEPFEISLARNKKKGLEDIDTHNTYCSQAQAEGNIE